MQTPTQLFIFFYLKRKKRVGLTLRYDGNPFLHCNGECARSEFFLQLTLPLYSLICFDCFDYMWHVRGKRHVTARDTRFWHVVARDTF